MARETSFYSEVGETLKRQAMKLETGQKLKLGRIILDLRQRAGLSGAELCRRSGAIDPRTLNAIEKGRIRNPSLDSLQGIAKGLGCLVRDFFTQAEMGFDRNYYVGSQKGAFQAEFPRLGLRLISATPPSPQFFCGKLFLSPKRKVEGNLFASSAPLFVEVFMGRIEFAVEEKVVTLKEGENLFFNGGLRHSLRNLLNRESAVWLVTAPSFFLPRLK